LGADYAPPHVDTHFSYPDDHNNFGRVSLRCVGIGECRRQEKGTMCPSYRVTMEEKHSTRGRARLLFEMLEGNPLSGGWKSEEVHDALDLCLACKGCKGDCPVNVDMATYKAEFLSHYYEGRLRPRHAYAMGWIFWWARLASLAPNLVNLVTHTPILGHLAKWAGGIAQKRSVPKFASQTFKQWFRERPVKNADYPPVILWPDTFNNHFHPQTAKAAVEVLEDAGFRVLVPQAALCCGRPLYDFGMLDTAKQMLRNILTELQAEIRAGIPMVGLEPSCAAVFRDELKNLMPDDEDAKRLREQTYTLAEFLQKEADYHPPQLKRKAVVHGHCHQKAIMKFESDKEILKRLGLDFEVLDSGCCGMAGSFGFEAEHYDVSMDVGELKVLPAVRETANDTLLIADGFSCREQIQDGTDRKALHLAEVLQMALEQGELGREAKTPELTYHRRHPQRLQLSSLERALCLGVGAVMLGGLLSWKGRRLNAYFDTGSLS
ncbi:MAG TPA: heterodisulfide reductase-related iron-sulfur binding cluster, partial [Planctomycetaceae bacterium]|nr:heterodisulfide reductase-related iron-sulfur binding cluster [Planctomycetaceae bacterium]